MSSLKEKENRIKKVIIIAVILSICGLQLYLYIDYKKTYQDLISKQVNGIIIEKDRITQDNPKAYYIKIAGEFRKDIPFGLIDKVSIGDTLIKIKGNNYYSYFTANKIIKELIPRPKFFGFPKDNKPYVEIIERN